MKRCLLFVVTMLLIVGCGESSTDKESAVAKLTVAPQLFNAEAKGNSYSVMISSNEGWEVTDSPAWCNVSPMSGVGNATLIVTVSTNQTPEMRSGTIRVAAGDKSIDIVVSQAAGEALPALADVCTAMDDLGFMTWCYNNYDANTDGKVSMSEANAVWEMEFEVDYKLRSLKGIEYFTNLKKLRCSRCFELLSVDLGANLKIESCYLELSSQLASVTLPSNIKEVYVEGLSNRLSLYCKATTPPSADISLFTYNTSYATLYVPRISVDAYKSADGWREFQDRIVGYDF
ncbi:MAG: BACON domain-containing protein [Alistipes sp.]|nr:BACON domain-containing protein [Alistipes sp.]